MMLVSNVWRLNIMASGKVTVATLADAKSPEPGWISRSASATKATPVCTSVGSDGW